MFTLICFNFWKTKSNLYTDLKIYFYVSSPISTVIYNDSMAIFTKSKTKCAFPTKNCLSSEDM